MTATVVKRRSDPGKAARLSVDVCVVGAGISGVIAALQAARLGRRVALVDALPALGGQAVHSLIGGISGLYSNGPHPIQLTRGLADQLLADLDRQGALHFRRGPMTTVVMYDPVMLGRWMETQVQAEGIRVVLGAVLDEVVREDRRLQSAVFATRYGRVQIGARAFIDATGDAALTWMAGLPCREPAAGPIYGTEMIVLDGIEEVHVPSRSTLLTRLRETVGEYRLERQDGFLFAFPGRRWAVVNMTHVVTPLEPLTASKGTLVAKAQADEVVRFLQREFPDAFAGARVRAYGLVGQRQTRWIVGRHQLTVEEVRQGVRFADAVARCAWPIELHDQVGQVWREPFPDDHLHFIPLGSLLPPEVDNLVAVGRCLDGDVAALSSVRVMGPCMATGMAAAHLLDLADGGSVHGIDLGLLQERLRGNLE